MYVHPSRTTQTSIPARGEEFLLAAGFPAPDAERLARLPLVVVQGTGTPSIM